MKRFVFPVLCAVARRRKNTDVEAWFKFNADLTDSHNGHFTEEKIVTFKNFAGQYAFMPWQTGHKAFQPK